MNNNLAETLFRHAIGYDPLIRFPEVFQNVANFPPHNISKLDESRYRLTMAVAGFAKCDITVEVLNATMTITGAKAPSDTPRIHEEGDFLYRGIALRDFTRQFKIGENVEVVNATLQDGILIVDLARTLPESERPKQIPVI